jgi:hypothetical protein
MAGFFVRSLNQMAIKWVKRSGNFKRGFLMHQTTWPIERKVASNPRRGTDHLFSSAEELAEQIKSKIKRVTQGRVRNLDVFLTGTHVVIEGFCSSFHPFQLAQHVAMEATDDLMVDNQIDVGFS